MAGFLVNDGNEVGKEMGKTRMTVDERDVKKVETTITSSVNPFKQSDDEEICHLASELTASENVESDLLTAHEQGKRAMTTFCKRRLLSSEVLFMIQ